MISLAYNTNGLRNLSLKDAVSIVAGTGYKGIELSLHKNHIDPFRCSHEDLEKVKKLLVDYNMNLVCIATGEKNVLSTKDHEPSLISDEKYDREMRIDYLKDSIKIARILEAPVVNFASGFKYKDNNVSAEESYEHLIYGIRALSDVAGDEVKIAIEPEPEMFISTSNQAAMLVDHVGRKNFFVNLDLGHVQCCEQNILQSIDSVIDITAHIHIEDIKDKKHIHLIPGEGDMNFEEILKKIYKRGYDKAISVELYDHANAPVSALAKSFKVLDKIMKKLSSEENA